MATPIPDNRVELSLADVLGATGGELATGSADGEVRGVTTDSRVDVAGKLFVALSGESFDGHRFVAAALAAGARAALVARPVDAPEGCAQIVVQDPLTALGDLARLHRRRWGGKVVAVAGSAGKTTTRSAVGAALAGVAGDSVHAAPGNLNNRVGVPMVLFGVEARHGVAVVEIGTNQRGEVAELARVTEPDVAVLTLIAIEHSEGLGDLDDVEAEEGALFAALSSDATAIGNVDDARVKRQLERCPARRRLGYGHGPEATTRVVERRADDVRGATLILERSARGGRERITLQTSLLGSPGALAVAAAVTVADVVNGEAVPLEVLAPCFRGVGEAGRLRPVELADGTLVLDDSYNANPVSVLAAVATAREIADGRGARLVLVLGEMRELGALSQREHARVGEALANSRAAALVAVAGDARHYVAAARHGGVDAEFAADADLATDLTLARVTAGDVVLVKASRGVRAERVVEAMVRAKGRAA